jgi:hypothetical protein
MLLSKMPAILAQPRRVKSPAIFHHRAIVETPMTLPGSGLFGAIAGRHPHHN